MAHAEGEVFLAHKCFGSELRVVILMEVGNIGLK